MNKVFTNSAWDQYQYILNTDKKLLKKVNTLIKDIDRNGYIGLGKPEPLKNELTGFWSRQIDKKNRIVYRIDEDNIIILSCYGHYS